MAVYHTAAIGTTRNRALMPRQVPETLHRKEESIYSQCYRHGAFASLAISVSWAYSSPYILS